MTAINVLGISLALGFPWLSGWLLLVAVAAYAGPARENNALNLGLAFFIGQLLLVLGMWLSDRLLGHWSIWPPLTIFFLTGAAATLLRQRIQRPAANPEELSPLIGDNSESTRQSPAGRLMTICLLALCALHLGLTAVEILHRPVFPWDGWLNWMYRAKAWFFADAWLAFDTPAMWFSGVRENAYAVAGNHYPPLLPLTAVWMALTTGGWSETLINLPTLCAGIAMGLAIFGLGRETGLARPTSALATYLFLSLPLVGAHLSLAGMADVWMAGFAGLGFALIFSGLYRQNRLWLGVGILLLATSRLVKLEGVVWLLAGLLFTSLVRWPRSTLAAIAACAVLAAGLSVSGINHLELPVLGAIGIVDGRLQIPLIGSYALANWELLDDYRDNFLRGGSWHLLWAGLAVMLALLLRYREWRLAGTIAAGLLSLAAALLFIFQFTENGAWAEDWSAINRLPLHFAPFLALALAIGVQRLHDIALPACTMFKVAIFGISGAALGVAFAWMASEASRGESGAVHRIETSALTAVIGKVARDSDESLVYTAFQDGVAVVTSGPISLDAKAASLITVFSAGENREAFNFFWRNSQSSGELHSVFVDGRGELTLDLGDHEEWQGTIREIGITAFDDGNSLSLQGITIAPNNAAAQRRKALADWITPNSWSQRSVNWVDAGAATTQIALPTLLALAVTAAAMMILLLQTTWSRTGLSVGLTVALLAWLVLDTRWLVSRLTLGAETASIYPAATAKALIFGGDERVYASTESARAAIDRASEDNAFPPVVVVGSENDADKFQRLRARYHLLPLAGLEVAGPTSLRGAPADYALVLKSAFRQPATPDNIAKLWLSGLATGSWTVLYDQESGALLSYAGTGH
jgi:hypothetical protein